MSVCANVCVCLSLAAQTAFSFDIDDTHDTCTKGAWLLGSRVYLTHGKYTVMHGRGMGGMKLIAIEELHRMAGKFDGNKI